ncbi:MAG: hypothetical protein Q8N79_02310 [Candidatus Methanoperedens sp.]|nr:hypothetical protein [Candidatus Methanoperedens sp.]
MQKYKFYIGSDSGAFGERYREYIFYFLGYNFEQAKYKAEKYVENLNRKWDADADLSEYFYLIEQEQRKRRKNKNNSGRNEMKIIYLEKASTLLLILEIEVYY